MDPSREIDFKANRRKNIERNKIFNDAIMYARSPITLEEMIEVAVDAGREFMSIGALKPEERATYNKQWRRAVLWNTIGCGGVFMLIVFIAHFF